MRLNVDSLSKALTSLKRAYDARIADVKNEFLLDACIQRFEYSYELSCKLLKRFLEITEHSGIIIDEMSFPELIRTGYERGLLLSSWDVWKDFRYARNLTSHTYDEKKALEVFEILPRFIDDADFLLQKLQQSNMQ